MPLGARGLSTIDYAFVGRLQSPQYGIDSRTLVIGGLVGGEVQVHATVRSFLRAGS